MKKYRLKLKKAFTLFELILYVALTSTIIFTISVFYNTISQENIRNKTIDEVNSQGAQIMQTISQSIRNANSITSPSLGVSSTSLVLVMPTAALSPTNFALSGTNLNMTEGTNASVQLNSNRVKVTSLSFQNVSQSSTLGIIRIQFTLAYNSTSTRLEYNYTQTFTSSISMR